MSLELTSSVMSNGGEFPKDYTCNGRNVSLPLEISGVPIGAQSLVLIFDDPDAAKEPAGFGRTYDHWILYNIPPIDQKIPENTIPEGAKFAINSSGGTNYVGPCQPTLRHRYSFRLYALGSVLEINNPTKEQIVQAMQGQIIEQTELYSYYEQTEDQ